ncbi:hypothetical protein GGR56DRAFT_612722 [Xylariaceae sp. FL0804]|nr:hypothetical protein GGR56DRAFT_612722 [Xylariaceae sp. FL0804]
MMLMPTQGPAAILGVSITLMVLNVLIVATRFYRVRLVKDTYKIDDWLVLPALALNIGMSVATWYGINKHAVGYPTPTLQTRGLVARTPLDEANETITINNKVFFIVYSLYPASVSFSKASILCLYWRIFCRRRPWGDVFKIVTAFMLVIVFLFGVCQTFPFVFACGTHFAYYWENSGSALVEHCIDTQILTYSQSVSDFIIDCIVILIPIPLVWRLHMPVKRKLGVTFVFLTASIAVAASAVKLSWFLWENRTPFNPEFDQDLLITTYLFWAILESYVGLIAVCLPTLRLKYSKSWSLEAVVSALRSKVSLNSLRSVKSKEGTGLDSESRGTSQDVPAAEVENRVASCCVVPASSRFTTTSYQLVDKTVWFSVSVIALTRYKPTWLSAGLAPDS